MHSRVVSLGLEGGLVTIVVVVIPAPTTKVVSSEISAEKLGKFVLIFLEITGNC